MAKTPSRIFKIICVGDSNAVADMLEDISKHIRDGWIHHKEDSFYEFDSYGYVKEQYRRKEEI